MKSDKVKTIIVSSHTHWDREWYLSFEEFRFRLVDLLDEVLALLEAKDSRFRAFNLDGQAIMLEDYLAIRPEKKDLIRKYVSRMQLMAGPFYTQPDLLLASGEALVRNLLYGKTLAEQYGHFPRVGYLPDCFGFNAQLPQILLGFGIDNIIFYRGLSLPEPALEIYWKGPDKSVLFGHHLARGYGHADTSKYKDRQSNIDTLKKCIEYYLHFSKADVGLLNHGSDHCPVDSSIVEIIHHLGVLYPEIEFQHGALEDYVNRLRDEKSDDWPILEGMLRDTKRHPDVGALLVHGNLSCMMPIKQANYECQNLLTKWAEPLSAINRVLFGEDLSSFVKYSWNMLLKNHAHDSLAGCIASGILPHIIHRFSTSKDVSSGIINRILHTLGEHERKEGHVDEYQIMVYNPVEYAVSDVLETDIYFPRDELAAGQQQNAHAYDPSKQLRNVEIMDGNGIKVPADMIYVKEQTQYYPLLREGSPLRRVLKARVRFPVKYLPPMGYRKYRVCFSNAPVKPRHTLVKSYDTLENEKIKVVFTPEGTFDLIDKETGRVYRKTLHYEDGGDFGDEASFSKPFNDEIVTSIGCLTGVNIIHAGESSCTVRMEHKLQIPASITYDDESLLVNQWNQFDLPREKINGNMEPYFSRSKNQCVLRITTDITMIEGSKLLRLNINLKNTAKFHRLRLVISTGLQTDHVYALQQYDIQKFPASAVPVDPSVWIEDQPTTYPHHGFIDMSDGHYGLAVLSKGLPEFEVPDYSRHSMALTLLRSVGHMSRDGFASRAYKADKLITVPEAQCLGDHNYEVALLPHHGDWQSAELLKVWQQYSCGLRCISLMPSRVNADKEWQSFSFLELAAEGILLESCKSSENGQYVIIRLANYTDHIQRAKLRLNFNFKKVHFARLDETLMESGPDIEDKNAVFDIPPKKIVTLAVTI